MTSIDSRSSALASITVPALFWSNDDWYQLAAEKMRTIVQDIDNESTFDLDSIFKATWQLRLRRKDQGDFVGRVPLRFGLGDKEVGKDEDYQLYEPGKFYILRLFCQVSLATNRVVTYDKAKNGDSSPKRDYLNSTVSLNNPGPFKKPKDDERNILAYASSLADLAVSTTNVKVNMTRGTKRSTRSNSLASEGNARPLSRTKHSALEDNFDAEHVRAHSPIGQGESFEQSDAGDGGQDNRDSEPALDIDMEPDRVTSVDNISSSSVKEMAEPPSVSDDRQPRIGMTPGQELFDNDFGLPLSSAPDIDHDMEQSESKEESLVDMDVVDLKDKDPLDSIMAVRSALQYFESDLPMTKDVLRSRNCAVEISTEIERVLSLPITPRPAPLQNDPTVTDAIPSEVRFLFDRIKAPAAQFWSRIGSPPGPALVAHLVIPDNSTAYRFGNPVGRHNRQELPLPTYKRRTGKADTKIAKEVSLLSYLITHFDQDLSAYRLDSNSKRH